MQEIFVCSGIGKNNFHTEPEPVTSEKKGGGETSGVKRLINECLGTGKREGGSKNILRSEGRGCGGTRRSPITLSRDFGRRKKGKTGGRETQKRRDHDCQEEKWGG